FSFPSSLTAPPDIYTLSLHDALPISQCPSRTSWNATAFPFIVHCWQATRCASSVVTPFATAVSFPVARSITHTSPNCPSAFVERSEEHTSELQSRGHLVCRLLLEKKK